MGQVVWTNVLKTRFNQLIELIVIHQFNRINSLEVSIELLIFFIFKNKKNVNMFDIINCKYIYFSLFLKVHN